MSHGSESLGGEAPSALGAVPSALGPESLGGAAPLVETFMAHLKKAAKGGESGIVSWGSTHDQAFRRITSKDPFLEGIAAYYSENCSTAERDAINAELAKSPFQEFAVRTMVMFHGSRFTEADRARCVTKNPGPDFFMLCDDEELGTGDDGEMDGDLKIRQSCSSWVLLSLNTLGTSFVEYSGEDWNGETVGIGVLYTLPTAGGSNSEPCMATQIYAYVDGERRPSEGQKDQMDILSSLVEAFTQSLDVED